MQCIRLQIVANDEVADSLEQDIKIWDRRMSLMFDWFFALRDQGCKTKDILTNVESVLTQDDCRKYLLETARSAQLKNLKKTVGTDEEILAVHHDFYRSFNNITDEIRSVQSLIFTGVSEAGQRPDTGRQPTIKKYPLGHDHWVGMANRWNSNPKNKPKQANEFFLEAQAKYYEEKDGRDKSILAARRLLDLGVFPLFENRSTKCERMNRVACKRAAGEIKEYEGKNRLREAEKLEFEEALASLTESIPVAVVTKLDEIVAKMTAISPTFNIAGGRQLKHWPKIRKRWLSGGNSPSDPFFAMIYESPEVWQEHDYVSRYRAMVATKERLSRCAGVEVLTLNRRRWPVYEDDTRPTLIQRHERGKLRTFLKINYLFNERAAEIELMPSHQLSRLRVEGKVKNIQRISFGTKQGRVYAWFKSASLYKLNGRYYFNIVIDRDKPEENLYVKKLVRYFGEAYSKTKPNVDFSKPFRAMTVDLGIRPLAAVAVLQWRPNDLNGDFVEPHRNGSFYRISAFHLRDRQAVYSNYIRRLKLTFEKLETYRDLKSQDDKLTERRALEAELAEDIQKVVKSFKKLKAARRYKKDQHGYDWLRATCLTISLLQKWMDRHLVKEERTKCSLEKYWRYYRALSKDLIHKFTSKIIAVGRKTRCDVLVFENLENYSTSSDNTREENKLLTEWKKQKIRDILAEKASRLGMQVNFDVNPAGTSARHWRTGNLGYRDTRHKRFYSVAEKPVSDQVNGALGIARKWITKQELHSLFFKVVELNGEVYRVFDNAERKRVTGALVYATGRPYVVLSSDMRPVVDAKLVRALLAVAKESRKFEKLWYDDGFWFTENEKWNRIRVAVG